MKKLLTICLLLATTFTVKAQELTKEQTLEYLKSVFIGQEGGKYLNSSSGKIGHFKRVSEMIIDGCDLKYNYEKLKITSDIITHDTNDSGTIKFSRIESFDLRTEDVTGDWIKLNNNLVLYFTNSAGENRSRLYCAPEHTEKVLKALNHLRKLCGAPERTAPISVTKKTQQPTFDETVSYINDIFKENKLGYYIGESNKGRMVKGITAVKTGKVIIYEMYKGESVNENFDVILTSINLFDLLINYSESFRANGDYNQTSALLLRGNGSTVGFFAGASATEPLTEPLAERLKKALKHLRSLCDRQADPFGN